jgi:hypothetical protein
MKRLFLLAVFTVSGLANAQSVDWNAAFSGCTSEAREFDKAATGSFAPSLGRSPNWRDNQDYFAKELGTFATPNALQRALTEQRAMGGSSEYERASARLSVCGLSAALNQVQRSTASAAPASASPSVEAGSQGSVRGCMKQNSATSSFSNQCNTRINLSWCAVPHSASDSSSQPCESQRFSSHELSQGDSVRVDEGALIAWFACQAPRRPGDLRYVSGTGLMGRCVR